MAPLHFLLLLVSLLAIAPCIALAGNCSQIAPVRLSRPGSIYDITGSSAAVFPAYNDAPVPGAVANWTLFSLIERNRIIENINGVQLPASECYDPGGDTLLLMTTTKPFTPGVPNQRCFSGTDKPCGGLYQHLDIGDMNCYLTHKIEPFMGTMRESVYSTITHPDHPSFSMIAAFHLVDSEVTVYPLENDTTVVYHYEPNALKMTYEVSNFPWLGPSNYVVGTYNNASYLGLWFTTEITVPPGNIQVQAQNVRRLVTYNSSDEVIKFTFNIDSAYLIDGEPWLQPVGSSRFNMNSTSSVSLGLYSSLSLCPTQAGHWAETIYDPSLSTLFSGGEPPVAPGTPAAKKSGLTTGQIAVIATVVPIVVLLALFVIIATKVPAVRRMLFKSEQKFPSSKEQVIPNVDSIGAASASAPAASQKPPTRGTWTKSKRPSQ